MVRSCMSGHWTLDNCIITQVPEATSKTNCPKTILPPPLETPKDIATKMDKPTYGTELYHRANLHADRREISVLGQKIHISPYAKILDFGVPLGYRSQKGRLCVRDRYVPSCKISVHCIALHFRLTPGPRKHGVKGVL